MVQTNINYILFVTFLFIIGRISQTTWQLFHDITEVLYDSSVSWMQNYIIN